MCSERGMMVLQSEERTTRIQLLFSTCVFIFEKLFLAIDFICTKFVWGLVSVLCGHDFQATFFLKLFVFYMVAFSE